MTTKAEVTAVKIRYVAHRVADGYEVTEEADGAYMVWDGPDYPVEIVSVEYGRPYVTPIPRDADPALLAADLLVKYAADRQPL